MNNSNKTQTKIQKKTIHHALRLSLAVALAGTLAACEDVPTPAPKARPPVAEVTPTPEAKPTPPVTPTPVATPEVKPEPVVVKAEDDGKPVSTLAAARKMLDAGDGPKALELARLAVRETPRRSAAWNVLGRAELRAGKRKDAIESFEKAVELNPKSSYAHNSLGLALIYDKQFDEASDAL